MRTPTERLSAALSDRYRIERELDQGGMATVYLAHDLKHDRKVAIKVLKPELAAMSEVLERLASALSDRYRIERELRHGGRATMYTTTATLRHPPILPLAGRGRRVSMTPPESRLSPLTSGPSA